MKDISMHVLDIVQNSINANSTEIKILLEEDTYNDILLFEVTDNGDGMDKEFLAQVKTPFATTRKTRNVGLGIPFLNDTCLDCGGSLDIKSSVGDGTYVKAVMAYNHIDRPPLGDIVSSIYITIVSNPNILFLFTYIHNDSKYVLDTKEIKNILGSVELTDPEVMTWLKKNIENGVWLDKNN